MRARIETVLAAPPDVIWEVTRRSSTLVYVNRGMLGFDGSEHFPARWSEGQAVDTRLRFFGVLPAWKHHLHVHRCDDEARVLQTFEGGGFVERWNHRIEITEAPDGTHYVDEVDIEAGPLTSVVWLYTKALYRYRQKRLQRLVAQMRRPN